MTEEEQAKAYSEADFSTPHEGFVDLWAPCFPGHEPQGTGLDLGCGPADVTLRFARRFPRCRVHGVDGSAAMLRFGHDRLAADPAGGRVTLIEGYLPGAPLPQEQYDFVISNSLLHHLPDPSILWQAVRRHTVPGAPVLVMDLHRPESEAEADAMRGHYCGQEPEVLQRDFYNSLLAAFTVDEITEQLRESGLEKLKIVRPTDRHVLIHGRV